MNRPRRYATLAIALVVVVGVFAALQRGGEDPTASSPAGTDRTPAQDSDSVSTSDADGHPATTNPQARTTTGRAGSITPEQEVRPYELVATRRCLRSAGYAVSAIRSDDVRLRALGDLAQHTSLELRHAGRTLGLAFGDTRLLSSLLEVPDDAYRLEVQRNALLMYRPAARREARLVRACLRP